MFRSAAPIHRWSRPLWMLFALFLMAWALAQESQAASSKPSQAKALAHRGTVREAR